MCGCCCDEFGCKLIGPYWYAAAVALVIGSLGAISYFTINPNGPLQSSIDPGSLLRVPASYLKEWSAPTPEKPVSTPVAVAEPVTNETAPAPVAPVNRVAVATSITKTPPVTAAIEPAVKPVVVVKPVASKPEVISVTKPVAPVRVVAKVKPAPAPVVAATTNPSTAEQPVIAETEAVAAPVKAVRTGPLFVAVAGVFSSKQNALGLMKRLNAAGYDASVMPEGGKKKVYKVGAMSSAVREELVGKLSAIDAITGAETWIMKK